MRILLADIMYKRNLTVRQVSIMTGIPKSTIHNIMIGKTSPTLDTLAEIADGLKISINDLFQHTIS